MLRYVHITIAVIQNPGVGRLIYLKDMEGIEFSGYVPPPMKNGAGFDELLSVFLELLPMAAGDVGQAMSWLTSLDRRARLTGPDYGIGDFFEDLKKKGYVKEDPVSGGLVPGRRAEGEIRKNALQDVFGKLKAVRPGNHPTRKPGAGDEAGGGTRPFVFGDSPENIRYSESIRNAQTRTGSGDWTLAEEDLEVQEMEAKTRTSTVLMIDISHSMILYGEDRITPAKKVAMALAELITTRYPMDTLDILVFGNDARQISIRDLPYLEVGPYHTNTVAGLELAMDILRRKKNRNKQIFMITDGKPTCIRDGAGGYYKNSFGLDPHILRLTLNLALQCRKLRIPVTTFMLASDPWLQEFVRDFTSTNGGRAYYSGTGSLGEFVFEDFERNRKGKAS